MNVKWSYLFLYSIVHRTMSLSPHAMFSRKLPDACTVNVVSSVIHNLHILGSFQTTETFFPQLHINHVARACLCVSKQQTMNTSNSIHSMLSQKMKKWKMRYRKLIRLRLCTCLLTNLFSVPNVRQRLLE